MNDRQFAILIEMMGLGLMALNNNAIYMSAKQWEPHDLDAAEANSDTLSNAVLRLVTDAQALDDTGTDGMTDADREHILRGVRVPGGLGS